MTDNTLALEIKNLTKEYKLYDSELQRLKESFHPFHKKYHKPFRALDDVNFQIKKGEKVGFIGSNGAGKSTLLKIITGVLHPTGGIVDTDGKISALLELGAGFNPNYTGIENIRLNGTLSGLTEAEINESMQNIIDFADIGDFINQPVKLYSSGMFVRLAFATQIFSKPDILIVDEALSVGDIRFQQKCYRAMTKLMEDKTVLLVTHDTAAVTRFCDRVIWLDHGKVVFDGDAKEALERYKWYLINESIAEKDLVGTNDYNEAKSDSKALFHDEDYKTVFVPPINPGIEFKGNGNAQIYECGLLNAEGNVIDVVEPLQRIKVIVRARIKEEAGHPIIGLSIRDRVGNDVIGINTQTLGIELPPAVGNQEFVFDFVMPELNQGQYTMTIGLANGFQADHVQMCWADDAIVYRMANTEHDIPGTIYMTHGDVKVYQLG